MSGINKAIILGNLGKDPEIRYMPNGGQVTNITVATSETWKDKATGESKENTEWHRIVFFNKLAEIAGQYLKKGSQVYIEGSLKTRKWQGQDGQDRYTTEIVASEMQMLGSKGNQEREDNPDAGYEQSAPQGTRSSQERRTSASDYSSRKSGAPPPPPSFQDDDIPFD